MIRPQVKKIRDRSEERLAFVRDMPCLIISHGKCLDAFRFPFLAHAQMCDWNKLEEAHCEAHHVYDGVQGGTALKPDDSRTVPLCQSAHEEFHRIGKQSFEAKYGLDLEAHIRRINAEFAKLHPSQPKKERKKQTRGTKKIHNCACRKDHDLPWDKVQETEDGRLIYRCPTSNAELEARK